MTAMGILASAVMVLGFAVALVLVLPAARRRRLGVLHPAIAWLALEAVFFGVGSVALAFGEGRLNPAIYLAGCVLATAIGVRVVELLGPLAPGTVGLPDPVDRPLVMDGRRRLIPAILAIGAVAVLLPTFAEIGLPLLSSDATVARGALVGIPIQLVRVAIPGLAAVLLLEWLAKRPAFGHSAVTWTVIGVLIAFMLSLASRYLVVELMAAVAIAWVITGRAIPVRAALAVAAIGLVGFVAIGVLRAPDDFATRTGLTAAERTVSRLFLVQPRTLDALQANIPGEQPYFMGLTWFRRLGALVGRTDIPNLGYWIYPKVVDAPQDVAGYAAPGLIGESWANFGPAGIGLFVLFGIGLEYLASWTARRRAAVPDITAGSLAILFVARTHALGLLGLGLLLALVLGWWLLAGARMHRTVVPGGADA